MKKYRNRFLTEDEVRQLIDGYCEQNNNEQMVEEKRNEKILKHSQNNMLELTSIHD